MADTSTEARSTEASTTGAIRDDSGAPTLPPAAAAVVRRRRVEMRQRRLTRWGIAASVVFLALLGALIWFGYQSSLRVSGGSDSRETNPEAPGFVAEPQSTPTDLYVMTDDVGEFASALLVVPDASGQGGTAVPLTPSFVVPEYEGAPPMFLGDLYADGGIDGFRERLGIALRFAIDSAEVVPSAALGEVAGTEPVEIENVDNLVRRNEDGTEDVVYPAGPVSLAPSELATFLSFEGIDDPAPNQALRAQTLWEELLSRASTAPPTELSSGERSEGAEGPSFSEALSALVTGEVLFDSVPMAKVPVPNTYLVAWMPDEGNLDGFVARVVPVPRSPVPGIRIPVAILNGTPDPDATSVAVPIVVAAGGEVTLVGNADSFEIATTTVEYSGEAAAETANQIAQVLEVTATPTEDIIDGAAVRIVLGSGGAE